MNRACHFLLLLLFACVLSSCENRKPEIRVHRMLTERSQTLSIAEGFSGGAVSARFTSIPGTSAYYSGSILAYSKHAKCELLDVSYDSLSRAGDVNDYVVRKMAESVRCRLGTHFSLALIGIAGPSGGLPDYPVGTVLVAVSTPTRTQSRRFLFSGDREQVIQQGSTAAIEMLAEVIESE